MNAFLVDVGGTWTRFRSSSSLEKVPTPSRLRYPQKTSETLVHELVLLIAERAPTNTDTHISLGAAYDPESDTAYGSGPLWGSGRQNVPFRRLLERRRPDVRWTVTNDVTAALAHFASLHALPTDRYVVYVTISSGIALRTVYLPTGHIDVDEEGLQGEVGHLPAVSTASEAIRNLTCECGGTGHIAAISSGPAIPRVAKQLGIDSRYRKQDSREYRTDGAKNRLLQVIIEPVANLIRMLCALQPHVDLVGIGGGVPSGIGTSYEHELHRQLSTSRSYADSRTKGGPRLCLTPDNQVCPEIGAQLIAQNYFKIVK